MAAYYDIGEIQKGLEICRIRVMSLSVTEDVSAMVCALFIYLSIGLSTIFRKVKRKIIHNSSFIPIKVRAGFRIQPNIQDGTLFKK